MKFLALASRNFKEILRDKIEFIAILAIPVTIMLFIGFIGGKEFLDYTIPGLIVFGLLILAINVGRFMTMDKEKGFLSRLTTTPAKPLDFISGYCFGLFAILIVYILIFMTIGFLLGMNIAGSPLILFFIFFLIGLNCIAIGMIIGSLAKTTTQSESLFILFLPLAMISGAMMPLAMIPDALLNISFAFPFARGIDAARGVAYVGVGLEHVIYDILFLALFAVVFFVIAMFLFRNHLVTSKISKITSNTLVVVLVAGLLCFGFFGENLRFSNHAPVDFFEQTYQEEDIGDIEYTMELIINEQEIYISNIMVKNLDTPEILMIRFENHTSRLIINRESGLIYQYAKETNHWTNLVEFYNKDFEDLWEEELTHLEFIQLLFDGTYNQWLEEEDELFQGYINGYQYKIYDLSTGHYFHERLFEP